jgi:hypothetical protein
MTTIQEIQKNSDDITQLMLDNTNLCPDVISLITSYIKPILKFKIGHTIDVGKQYPDSRVSKVNKGSIWISYSQKIYFGGIEIRKQQLKICYDKDNNQYYNKAVTHINKRHKAVRKWVKIYPE